jgi:hypothetical protein
MAGMTESPAAWMSQPTTEPSLGKISTRITGTYTIMGLAP